MLIAAEEVCPLCGQMIEDDLDELPHLADLESDPIWDFSETAVHGPCLEQHHLGGRIRHRVQLVTTRWKTYQSCGYCEQPFGHPDDAIYVPILVDDPAHPLSSLGPRNVHTQCLLQENRLHELRAGVLELVSSGAHTAAACASFLAKLADVQVLGEEDAALDALLCRHGKDPSTQYPVPGDLLVDEALVRDLVPLLPNVRAPAVKVRIARLLTCVAARGVAVDALLQEVLELRIRPGREAQLEHADGTMSAYRELLLPSSTLRSAIEAALQHTVDRTSLVAVLHHLRDRQRPREVRQVLAGLVAIIPGAEAEDALIELIQDTEVAAIAFSAIGKRKRGARDAARSHLAEDLLRYAQPVGESVRGANAHGGLHAQSAGQEFAHIHD